MGGAGWGVMEGMKPVAGMVVVQFVFAGVNIFYKLAVSDGMDMRVLIAYRYIFASVVLAPLAYCVERKKRTKLTWRVIVLSFICGLCGGSLAQNLYISGMKLTSATFASAMTNLIPAITFVLAVLFRYEGLAIRTVPGQAKVAGTLLGVGGAMLLTFYKGAQVTLWPPTHVNLAAQLAARHHSSHPSAAATIATSEPSSGNRAMGSLLCTGSCFFYALWLILQARLSREYPFHYSTTALMCLMSALQSALFALCFDRDPAQWRLTFDVRLLAVVYTGVLASGVMLVVLSWCVKRRGPLFASVFNPMMLVIVAVLSSLLLGEELHLGSVLGAVLIVVGLYAVLWGKGREAAAASPEHGKAAAPAHEVPHIDIVVHRHPPPPPSPQQQPQSPEAASAAR
ncbi:WAT1-related protein At1g68170 [Lolium perenne]|uniref:WAT1-related protein At1g68170 n=1 Tax=Lolium perenne TaxID=4522 RepID=UPI0021EABAE5|nr:WAT1-related protein At1g68170-like [Lolium perenne]